MPIAARQPEEQRGKESVFGVSRGPGRLHQDTAQIPVAFPCSARLAFARALVVARTQCRPTGQMFSVGKR